MSFTIEGEQPTVDELRAMYARQAARAFFEVVQAQIVAVKGRTRVPTRAMDVMRRKRTALANEYFSSARMGLHSDDAWAEHGPDKLWAALVAAASNLRGFDPTPFTTPER